MAFKPPHLFPWLTLLILIGYFTTVAADICTFGGSRFWDLGTRTEYCYYGCCDDECCSSVGLIAGLCVGIGVVIFIIIAAVIFICRRRRIRGIVCQNQAAPPFVVHSTTQGGMIGTSGVQPVVLYIQTHQPCGPDAPPTSQAGFQSCPPQPQPYGNDAPLPVSGGDAAIPPYYDSLIPQAAGDEPNSGYETV